MSKCNPAINPNLRHGPTTRRLLRLELHQEGHHRLQNLNQKPEADKTKRVYAKNQRDEQDRDNPTYPPIGNIRMYQPRKGRLSRQRRLMRVLAQRV